MNKLRIKQMKGFTLVELLIVIALIAILSVAVLATINPIEQANKAKDSSVQNDAAEVLNAYERFYANANKYPWEMYVKTVPALSVDSAVFYNSTQAGFGICYGDVANDSANKDVADACNTTGTQIGVLSEADELKPSFAGKAAFKNVGTNGENKLWAFKAAGSGGSIYICYIPKAKSNRQMVNKLMCINSGAAPNPTIVQAGQPGCAALTTGDSGWSTPDLTGTKGMFRCVPE